MNVEKTITFADGQMVLDAFRTIYSGMRLLYTKRPELMISHKEQEQMLDRIREAKAEITSRESYLSPEVFRRIRGYPLNLFFTEREAEAITKVLQTVLEEAHPNPPYITALVGSVENIRRLIDELR